MNPRLIYFIALIILISSASAQSKGKIYLITYEIGGKEAKYSGRLICNDTMSQWSKKSKADTTVVTDSGRRSYISTNGYTGFVYKHFTQRKSFFQQSLNIGNNKNKNSYYSDTIYPMNWTLVSGTKRVGETECLKALTIFRGRSYTAWYAPSIPLSDGPWKFGGLPGLIMEVYDSDKFCHYSLSGLTMLENIDSWNAPIPIGNYSDFKKVTKAALKKVIAELEANDEVNPECPTCGTSKVKIETIENILED
jgi:GLPGLI family protein